MYCAFIQEFWKLEKNGNETCIECFINDVVII
jgi:hypothetical protein